MEDANKKWLVKSDNVILGPYTAKEVKQLVSDSLVSINDEVTEPFTFWWTLRDHPEFKDFAQNVTLQTRVTHLITGVKSRLQTITGKTEKNLEKTQTITSTDTPVEEAVFQSVDTVKQDTLTTKEKTPKKADFHSKLENKREAAKKINNIIKMLWKSVVIVSLGILLYIIYNEFFIPSKKTVQTLINVKQLGMDAYKKGNEAEAFKHLSQGSKKNLLGGEEKVALASLFLQKRDTEKTNEILKSLPHSLFNTEKVHSLKGLAYLSEKNFQVAKSFLLKSKELEEKSNKAPTRSLINLALVNYMQGNIPSAQTFIDQLIKSGYERGIRYYLEALSYLAVKSADTKKVLEDINTFIEVSPEYRQEFYVLLAWLNRKDEVKREDYIKKVLNEDPYFIEEYNYDLFTGHYLLDWSYLVPYCKDLFEEDPENPLFNSFYGFCHIKSNRTRQAQIYLETAKKQASDNILVTSIYVYSLIEKGALEQAESLLEVIQSHGTHKHTIPYTLKARIHTLRKEWRLVATTLTDLLVIDSVHPSGNGGLAQASFHLGNRKDYLTYKERTLRLYPHYKTLLTLQTTKEDFNEEAL